MRFFILLITLFTCAVQAGSDVSLPFSVLEQGGFSGAQQDQPVVYQIDNQQDWETFWAKHITITPKPPAQSIDFTQKQVIAVVDSDQPNSGYSLTLHRIEQENGELWVYATRYQPMPECINLGMVAQPYVIVTLPRVPGKAKLIFNTRNKGCSDKR